MNDRFTTPSFRSGFTLVELVVVLTAGSSLLMLAIGLVHRSMTIHQSAQQQQAWQRTAGRLGRDFRRDVRRATSAEAADNRALLTVETPDGPRQTAYQVVDAAIVRQQDRPEGPPRREVYDFVPGVEAIVTQQPGASRLRLLIRSPADSGGAPGQLWLAAEATPGVLTREQISEARVP